MINDEVRKLIISKEWDKVAKYLLNSEDQEIAREVLELVFVRGVNVLV